MLFRSGVNAAMGRYTNFANLLDLASLAVPAGFVDGLPFGVMLTGAAFSDAALADKLRHLRNYGSKVRYQNELPGMNSRLSELQAAFLRAKLQKLYEWNTRRVALAERYLKQLEGVGDLVLPWVPAWASPVWHLFVVRTARREALQRHLAAQEIGTQIHYPTPPHLSKAYAAAGWKRGDFPLAERLADEVFSLPIGPHVSAEQVDFVCEKIRGFFGAR